MGSAADACGGGTGACGGFSDGSSAGMRIIVRRVSETVDFRYGPGWGIGKHAAVLAGDKLIGVSA